jgi:nucleoside-diphosphate-sugar epimerase|tara:strand:+ start:8256 stop:9224 length:969 start_codon:yes stop_codon:yes gene_type:complete
MKILVTGGAGYLGSILVPVLLNKGYEVIVYDNLIYKQLTLLDLCNNTNFDFIHSDVRDRENLIKYIKEVDVIIPLAAIVGFPACERDRDLATQVNYEQIKFISDNSSSNQRIIFPNSNSGYGVGEDGVYCTEDSPLNPVSHYGQTKVDAEKVIMDSGNGIGLRLATVFGLSPRMRLDLLVNEFVYKALTDKYLTVFEKNFIRNYVHIRDVAYTFEFMINNLDKNTGEIYNVGLSDSNLSKAQLVEKIKEFIPEFAVTYSDYYEDPDKRDYIVSNEKIEKIGWKPKYSLDDGIKELIVGYKIIVNKDMSNFRNSFPITYGVSQ